MLKYLLSVAICVVSFCLNANQAEARGRLFQRPAQSNQVSHVNHQVNHQVSYGGQGGIAQAKSNIQASQGRMRHVGGSMGAGRYEGVGFSTRSAEDAIRNCCYWGQKTPIDIATARGPNGWYATVIYR